MDNASERLDSIVEYALTGGYGYRYVETENLWGEKRKQWTLGLAPQPGERVIGLDEYVCSADKTL